MKKSQQKIEISRITIHPTTMTIRFIPIGFPIGIGLVVLYFRRNKNSWRLSFTQSSMVLDYGWPMILTDRQVTLMHLGIDPRTSKKG